MTMDIPIPHELFTAFNDVTYFDEPHKYYVDKKQLISVTTLIHRYQEEFDEEYWSAVKASHYGMSQSEVKRLWRFINKKGTMKGSAIHDYAENKFENKIFTYPKQQILDEFGFDPIKIEYDMTKKHVDRFYDDVYGKLIPIKTELVLFDKETLIGGMLDILFWNVKAQEFQIWDWKTNKAFTMSEADRYLSEELYVLQDCDLEIYSLQLEMYKQIIQRNTGIKLGKSYVVWFSHNNDTYKIIETKNREYYANVIFSHRMTELAA
jgi:hypothetical protein